VQVQLDWVFVHGLRVAAFAHVHRPEHIWQQTLNVVDVIGIKKMHHESQEVPSADTSA
jgi:hypothetical protein